MDRKNIVLDDFDTEALQHVVFKERLKINIGLMMGCKKRILTNLSCAGGLDNESSNESSSGSSNESESN